MRLKHFLVFALICFGAVGILPVASEQVALTGIVRSEAKGPMEGVLVRAKLVGGTVAVTVVSDEQGRYVFPASLLTPGAYQLSLRAVGYVPAIPRLSVII
jgi:hypothetical protein